jgi:hypothetical protein
MPLINQRRGDIYSSSKHAPDEIQKSMFLPMMKNALMGGIGVIHKK